MGAVNQTVSLPPEGRASVVSPSRLGPFCQQESGRREVGLHNRDPWVKEKPPGRKSERQFMLSSIYGRVSVQKHPCHKRQSKSSGT